MSESIWKREEIKTMEQRYWQKLGVSMLGILPVPGTPGELTAP